MLTHPMASVLTSGVASGCQGCDPAVLGALESDRMMLCAACILSFPAAVPVAGSLEFVRARRAKLGLAL